MSCSAWLLLAAQRGRKSCSDWPLPIAAASGGLTAAAAVSHTCSKLTGSLFGDDCNVVLGVLIVLETAQCAS